MTDDQRLDFAEVWPLPSGTGPEDVAVDAAGRLFAGGGDGQIWCWPDTTGGVRAPEPFAHTGGRPLGIEIDPRDGSLVVCDAHRGLLRVRGDGPVITLADTVAGEPILFANNAAVAPDGVVYFSESSTRHGFNEWQRDVASGEPHGRLLRYDPADGETTVVAEGLHFPNGVALTPDGSAILVVETTTRRLLRCATSGGEPTVLASLPAYPDNLSPVGDGTYWIALPTSRGPRSADDGRRRGAAEPGRDSARHSEVVLIDGDGRLLRTISGPAGRYRMITGVRQHGGTLWLGSLIEPGVARVAL